ncbi:RAD51-associated protein 2 [Mixophyes fleayi]|uniref:RAD51-associated protein 2 n=1 Tax=Mixophyes fleayi TaxID=3061075 RepID=UPI003F4E0534
MASDMHRGQHSNSVDYIWHEQRKCMGAQQYQQLLVGTDRGTSAEIIAETIKEERHGLMDALSPHFVMFSECGTTSNAEVRIRNKHRFRDAERFPTMTTNEHSALILNVVELSVEKMILSQCDLIWENDIAAAYNSVYSTDIVPFSDVTTMNKQKLAPTKFPSFLFTLTDKGVRQSLYEANKKSANCHIQKIIWDSKEKTARKIENQKHCKRKRTVDLLEARGKRIKIALNINTCTDVTEPFMDLGKTTNLGISNKCFSWFRNPSNATAETVDHCGFVILCPEIEAYMEKNPIISTLNYFNTQQKYNISGDGCKMCDGGCSIRSVLKDLVLSCFSFGDRLEDVRGTYISQTDSSVDYSVPGGSFQQKRLCKIQVDCDESLCLTNNTDSDINLHVMLSLHPLIPASTVVFKAANCIEPGEPQGRKCLNWVAGKKSTTPDETAISANILTSPPKWNGLQKPDLSLPCIDKENFHFGNNGEPFLSTEETFSALLNYPSKLEKQHFLSNINFSTLAASLLGKAKNDFLCVHANGLQSTSKIESSHEMSCKSFMFSFKHNGIKLEHTDVEVLLSTENINKRTGSAYLDYTTVFNKQGFCFPSHYQNTVDTQHSEKDSFGKAIDAHRTSMCPKQLSVTETFKKVCLDLCLGEMESNNPKETYCSFRDEHVFYKSRATLDNTAAMKSQPKECKSKCPIANYQYINHPYTSVTEYNVDQEELSNNINKEINCDIFLKTDNCITFVCDTGIKNAKDPLENMVGVDKTQQIELHTLSENVHLSNVSSFTNTMCTLNLNTKQECECVNEIKVEEVTKVNTDGSSVGTPLSLGTMEFEMKAQFDLVLEELKTFHKIGEEAENSTEAKEGNGLKHTSRTLEVLTEVLTESITSNSVRKDDNRQDVVTDDKYICDNKIEDQEVPQQCGPAYPAEEESLYSTEKEGDVAKTFSWTPAFLTSNMRESSNTSPTETVTFSHGIRRVTPLKTRTGPLRIGLSKKAKIKQLHPYLR